MVDGPVKLCRPSSLIARAATPLLQAVGILAIVGFSCPVAQSQVLPVGDAFEEYARLLQLSGHVPPASHMTRPVGLRDAFAGLDLEAAHPWQERVEHALTPLTQLSVMEVGAFGPALQGILNTDRPWGTNNDGVWAGRGTTGHASAGIYLRAGPLSVTALPVVAYSSNRDFELWEQFVLAHLSPFSYPTILGEATIDRPQRFGTEPLATILPGQSSVRLEYGGAAAGVSTENMWWGPGVRNTLTMTNNAPGFPHAFLATSQPADIRVGKVQARWIWGLLAESDYFDDDLSNDRRFFTGIVADYEPSFLPGLFVGASRTFVGNMAAGERPSLADPFLILSPLYRRRAVEEDNPTGRPSALQVISLFGRWVLPESGLDIYGEWGRGELPWDTRDAIIAPEYSRGFVVGVQKAISISQTDILRISLEHTNLGRTRTAEYRQAQRNFFYMDDLVLQGYTHRGHVIGAGIGTGSMEHYAGVDLFSRWGRFGIFASRVGYDNDRFVRWAEAQRPEFFYFRGETELNLGLSGMVFYQGLEISGGVGMNHLLNRYYVHESDHTNFNVSVGLRYTFPGLR